jgi:lauroyl/myristoyl acyltransferase
VCAFRGRWVARSRFLGVRDPDHLRRRVVIEGEEHLTAAPGGTVLLGFHLGPPAADVLLGLFGHRLAWLGGNQGLRGALLGSTWAPLNAPSKGWLSRGTRGKRERDLTVLLRGRRILREGGIVFSVADGERGHTLFRVPLPGGALTVLSGWISLVRHTGARVVPVLTHLEGRTQVITTHPPLPVSGRGLSDDLAMWRPILSRLVEDYVRRFPEQCPAPAFGSHR